MQRKFPRFAQSSFSSVSLYYLLYSFAGGHVWSDGTLIPTCLRRGPRVCFRNREYTLAAVSQWHSTARAMNLILAPSTPSTTGFRSLKWDPTGNRIQSTTHACSTSCTTRLMLQYKQKAHVVRKNLFPKFSKNFSSSAQPFQCWTPKAKKYFLESFEFFFFSGLLVSGTFSTGNLFYAKRINYW